MDAPQTERTLEVGHLTLRSAREGDDHCLTLFGELDIASADALEAEFARVEATDAKRIVLDLSGLEFMDSTGVRALLALDARSRRDGGRLGILRAAPPVHHVLQITGVEAMLPFLD